MQYPVGYGFSKHVACPAVEVAAIEDWLEVGSESVSTQIAIGFFGSNFANKNVSPSNFAPVRLQVNRPCGRHWLCLVVEWVENGSVNHELAVEPHPDEVAHMANFQGIPLAEGLVCMDEWVLLIRIRIFLRVVV